MSALSTLPPVAVSCFILAAALVVVARMKAGAVSGIWKAATLILVALLVVLASVIGTGWWLAAGERDAARAALAKEQRASATLSASIDEQNRAIDGMARATLAAQERGTAAQATAAAKGKKYDAALALIVGTRATSCDEAMPAVRLLQEGVR